MLWLCSATARAETVVSLEFENGTIDLGPPDFEAAVGGTTSGEAPTAYIRLLPHMRDEFASLTAASIGTSLVIRLCGKEVAQPIIQTAIDSGIVQINLKPWDHANDMLEILRGGRPCPPDSNME